MKPTREITALKLWMLAATTEEQLELAAALSTSRAYLYQLSSGRRKASPELGAAIEHKTAEMHKASRKRLPAIYRTDLVEACRMCEYAAACLKDKAVRSDFPIINLEKTE